MKILFFTPTGVGKSPEILMGEELQRRGHEVTIVTEHRIVTHGDYEVVVGAMEVSCSVALRSAQSLGIPCYLHCEWIPPWRVGLESPLAWGYDRENIPQEKSPHFYHDVVRCLAQATAQSMAGHTFIRDAETFSGICLKGCLVRYPSVPFLWSFQQIPKQDYLVTVARLVPSKKVIYTARALALLNLPVTWKIIGAGPDKTRIQETLRTSRTQVEFLGPLPTESREKLEVLGGARLAVQNWSGIPPAEAAWVGTATVSMDHPYMMDLYEDTLWWSQNNQVEEHAKVILEAWEQPERCKEKAAYLREKMSKDQLNAVSLPRGAEMLEDILRNMV